jgi:transcriptional regulator with XRE-family HTH domain
MKKQTDAFGQSRTITTKKRRPNSADSRVGESIRAHRLAAGMSQGDLAKRLGVSFQQVQKYEKGTNRVGAGRLPQIADMFGVPIGALFKGTVDASRGKGTGGDVPVNLIHDATTVKLLTAYAEITDRSVRRNLSELVDRIAKAEKRKSRR